MYGTQTYLKYLGESTAYKTVGLFDSDTKTRGAASGNQIGVARLRNEFDSGTPDKKTHNINYFFLM